MTTGGTLLFAAQSAFYSKLTGDATLVALVGGSPGRIYDSVPENTTYPYIEIGDGSDEKDNTLSKNGRRASLTVEVWSRYLGSKEAAAIVDRICVLLERVSLTITGYTHVATEQERVSIERQSDGITRHAMIWFTVWATQN